MGKFGFVIRKGLVRVCLVLALIESVVSLIGCKPADRTQVSSASGPVTLVFPKNGAYTGAYVDFGEGESHVTYDALTWFEGVTGKHLALVGFGNFWGEQSFPVKTMEIINAYGAVPLVMWSPWDKPYDEMRGPDRFSLTRILEGKWDDYIDRWADSAKAYGKPMLVSWGLEMNGVWFPWAGGYYGGGKVVGHKHGKPLYAGPEFFKRAFRYVVDRVRARKADNILWGFHANHYGLPRKKWNAFSNYYPGAEYVDWIGLSVYGKMEREEDWSQFHNQMDDPYQELCQLDPDKPVIVAEWGVGEYPPGDKGEYIRRGLADMKSKYTRVRGAVFWHERWQNADDSYSNLRVNSSPESLAGYRAGIADPFWIGWPQFGPRR